MERLENNCCVNATLQIILNNPELREIWEEFFPETKDLYYKALKEGKSSAPNAVGNEFRKQLVQKSLSNLIDKDLAVQEDPTAFLEVFFNICKEKLSHMKSHFERMKYKQIAGSKLEPTIEKPESHDQFRISISNKLNQNTTLEELLKNHCLEINEVEENEMQVKYISEDQYVSLPNCLIIDLLTSNRRDASGVCIPTRLSFPKDLLKDEKSDHEYELEGFVVHLGESDKSGHYIAYRKVNGQWKEFNDHVVTDINENQLQQLLGNFQKKPSNLLHKLLVATKSILENSNPYVCILSYSKIHKVI